MRLFAKGKKDGADAAPQAPSFQPIDRGGLLGLLDQVVNGGQSGVLELREPRGTWVYAFQAGALTTLGYLPLSTTTRLAAVDH